MLYYPFHGKSAERFFNLRLPFVFNPYSESKVLISLERVIAAGKKNLILRKPMMTRFFKEISISQKTAAIIQKSRLITSP
jgi:hypothetical protein